MRHYEIILLVKPDSDRVTAMVELYHQFIKSKSGKIHHTENLGRQELGYPLKKYNKAYFVRMNVECDFPVQQELDSKFKLNDAIIQPTIIRRSDSRIRSINLIQSKAPEVQHKSFAPAARAELTNAAPGEATAQTAS